jgi:hypothetical protein
MKEGGMKMPECLSGKLPLPAGGRETVKYGMEILIRAIY